MGCSALEVGEGAAAWRGLWLLLCSFVDGQLLSAPAVVGALEADGGRRRCLGGGCGC